ncbi:head GIN domain-containing protein [Terrimonas rubra]|uniref:Head GIN domain-containing protein n=1 Tax=Terrimonas rubra TaxID=1035890 RepID=A0ABW6A9W9_9BACT
MKPITIALIALTLLCSNLLSAQKVITDNNANAQKRTLSGSFSAISVSSGVAAYLTEGNEEAVAVSAVDDEFRDRIITEVKNGTLHIYYKQDENKKWIKGDKRLKAYVSYKSLKNIRISSGASVTSNEYINADKLNMDLSSGAVFNGSIKADKAVISQNSGAVANVAGNVQQLEVSSSSGAKFKGKNLQTVACEASASSGGHVEVSCSESLNADASSGGKIAFNSNNNAIHVKKIKSSGGSIVNSK